MKIQAKRFLNIGEDMGLVGLLQRVHVNDEPLYILAYHRVDRPENQPGLDPGLVSATPELFEQEMRLIADQYRPVSAQEVLEAVERETALPRDPVLITVDDGYRDFKDVVFPITQLYGIRPVLFVPTAYVGQGSFWWDELYRAVHFAQRTALEDAGISFPLETAEQKKTALDHIRARLKRLPADEVYAEVRRISAELTPDATAQPPVTLNWDELRELAAAGVTIAAHSHTHPILTRIPLEEARREICRSQELIEREIGQALPIFALPDGQPYAFNDDLLRVFREEGFRVVLTMVEGVARLHRDDPLCLKRLGMSERMTIGQFHLHLTPTYGYRKSRQHERMGRNSRQYV